MNNPDLMSLLERQERGLVLPRPIATSTTPVGVARERLRDSLEAIAEWVELEAKFCAPVRNGLAAGAVTIRSLAEEVDPGPRPGADG